ncbi:MAG: hypothetical protein FWF03_05205 [Defluviitaleaceae bacterium]|nr:hypothetical protein [Defluviitaleaceae bacterium]
MRVIKFIFLAALAAATVLALTGCVPGDGANSADKLAGFFSGVWHGWIAPFSLIYSLFKNEISIYEAFNNGFWYELGYYMAIASGFGSLSITRRRNKKKKIRVAERDLEDVVDAAGQ